MVIFPRDRGKRWLALLVVAGAGVACQVVAGIEHVEKERTQQGDGGSTGPDGQDPGSTDPCDHARPPPLPEKDDAIDEELPPFYLALRTIKLIPDETDRYRGYDLDGVCTCDRRPGSAHGGGSSCTPKKDDCDGDGGIDNVAESLFRTFAPTGFATDEAANDSIAEGKRGLLLWIAKYNGKKNDREVQVGAMVTNGILDGSGCETTFNPGEGRAPPGWCGNDLWTFDPAFVRPGSKEPTFVGTGYVSDGELVFESSGGELKMFFGQTIVNFGSPISAGRLTQVDGKWKLEGVLTGRIPVDHLLRAIGEQRIGGEGEPVCQNDYFKLAVKPVLCERVDIATSSRFDLLDPPGPCNSISAAIGFTAEQASVGDELSEPEPVSDCSGVELTCP